MTMDEHLCKSLVIWVGTFPNFENVTTSMLSDGVALANVLHQIAPEYFTNQWLSKIRSDVVDNWRLKVSNLKKIYQGVMDFFYHIELPVQAPTPDFNKIVENEDEMELGRLLQLVLGCAINCEQKQNHIESIMKMEENIQTLLVNAIQDLMNGTSDSIPGSPLLTFDVQGSASNSSGIWTGASGLKTGAGPQIQVKSVMEQMEVLAVAKEELNRRCNELDHQVLVLSEEKKKLEEDNSHFCEKIEIMQAGGDVGSQSFRSKDLRKQVETLRDELFKVETSRDELRSRVENSEKERSDLSARNEELQILADEARTLKDEVDALRDMSDRVALYEGTIGTYKKKLDELSDLKRQVKILEEKNSEYMQQNMDLEEEIKKSVTWRPQLDLYKKQVADLHQKLSDETKKADRHLFENKKITDKLHTLTQEKERLLQERHSLKENVEELKCAVTAVGDLKTGQDLPDLGTLEIIPPEIREKLVRLQHENRVLKQKANDQSVESASVLQSMLNDLQERHNKLVQENRWDQFPKCRKTPLHIKSFPDYSLINDNFNLKNVNFSSLNNCDAQNGHFNSDIGCNVKCIETNDESVAKTGQTNDFLSKNNQCIDKRADFCDPFDCIPSQTILNGGLDVDPQNLSQNFSSLKHGLRWSSDSNLLVLRQTSAAFLTPFLHNKESNKLKIPPSSTFPSMGNNEPIIIRHIHEFKMTSSPTNEDSGCCRTSPSSFEGYDDHSYRSDGYPSLTDQYGTIDSGVSEMYNSGASPVVPPVTDECTYNDVSDVLPFVYSNQDHLRLSYSCHCYPMHHNLYSTSNCMPNKQCQVDLRNSSYQCQYSAKQKCNSSLTTTPISSTICCFKSDIGYRNVATTVQSVNRNATKTIQYLSKDITVQSVNKEAANGQLINKDRAHTVPSLYNDVATTINSLNTTTVQSKIVGHIQAASLYSSNLRNDDASAKVVKSSYPLEDRPNPAFCSERMSSNFSSLYLTSELRNRQSKHTKISHSSELFGNESPQDKTNAKTSVNKKISTLTSEVHVGNEICRKSCALLNNFVDTDSIEYNTSPSNSKNVGVNKVRSCVDRTGKCAVNSIDILNKLPKKSNEAIVLSKSPYMDTDLQFDSSKNSYLETDLDLPTESKFTETDLDSFETRTDSDSSLKVDVKLKITNDQLIEIAKKFPPKIPEKFGCQQDSTNNETVSKPSDIKLNRNNVDIKLNPNNVTHVQIEKHQNNSETPNFVYTKFPVHRKKVEISPEYIKSNSQIKTKNKNIRKSDSKSELNRHSLLLSDTEADYIDNKLLTSAFGAPLVKSESTSSIHISDSPNITDIEPSVTEYGTDVEIPLNDLRLNDPSTDSSLSEVNLRKFNFLTMEPSRSHNIRGDIEALIETESPKTNVSSGYFKRKGQKIFAKNNRSAKRKTAKSIATETFNAMFTLCTP